MLKKFIRVIVGVLLKVQGFLLQLLSRCSRMKLSSSLLLFVRRQCWCVVVGVVLLNQLFVVQFRVIILIYGSRGQEVCRCRVLFVLIQLWLWSIVYGRCQVELGVKCSGLSRLWLVISSMLSVVSRGCGNQSRVVRVSMFRLIVQIIWRQIIVGGNWKVQVKFIRVSFSVIRNNLCLNRNVEIVWCFWCFLLQRNVDRLVRKMNIGVYRCVRVWLRNSVGLVLVMFIGLLIWWCRKKVLWIWLSSMNSIIRLCRVLMLCRWEELEMELGMVGLVVGKEG